MRINIKKIAIFLFLFMLYLPHPAYAKAGGDKAYSSIYGIPAEKYTVKSIEYKIPPGIPLKDVNNFLFIKKGRKFSMYDLEKTLKIGLLCSISIWTAYFFEFFKT